MENKETLPGIMVPEEDLNSYNEQLRFSSNNFKEIK